MALVLCAWPVVVLVHHLLLLIAAWSCAALFGSLSGAQPLAAAGDQIYSRLVLGMLGSAQPKGLAIHWLGDWPSSIAPQVFAPSSAGGGGSWAEIVFAAGSSPVGVHLLQVAVNLILVMFATGVVVASFSRPRRLTVRRLVSSRSTRLAALVCLAYGVAAELHLSWGAGSGGEMALSMVATKILGLDSVMYRRLLVYGNVLSVGLNAVAVVAAAAVGALATFAVLRLCLGPASTRRVKAVARAARARNILLPTAISFGLLVAPVQRAVAFEPVRASAALLPPVGDEGPQAADAAVTDAPVEAAAAQDATVDLSKLLPSIVTITATQNGFVYRVNGRPQFIRGIGYNAITKGMTSADRAARYDRDFLAIHAAGANTLVGWTEQEFDDLLMAKAQEHDLGVILPFELEPTWAYSDPQVRQQLFNDITRRVAKFKDSPALRMWGLGNEVIHNMVTARNPRVQPFADFLVQAADLVHALDPNHPVVYRDAEDVFTAPLVTSLRGQTRPWFVYGMNFFTARMSDALTKGPARAMHLPLMISEFAPVGLRPADRPAGYAKLWNIITAHRDVVLGGCAYVWTTAGPEPLDRGFGLTNESGDATDGSLAALSSLFAAERAREARPGATVPSGVRT